MKNLLLMTILLSSCGAQVSQEANEAETTPEVTGDRLDFHGYVQTAFEITVDGVQFNDSEHFYTRFIQDLIIPAYPELAGSDIEVLGTYGISTFGTNSAVFVAPMAADGHLYSTVTDTSRHFEVVVSGSAEGTYRSRIVNRIGLLIDGEKSCYMLTSTINDITFSREIPIVFSDYSTQLNTYKCEVAPTVIEVPGGRSNDAGLIEMGVSSEDQVMALLGDPAQRSQTGPAYIYTASSGNCKAGLDQCSLRFNTNGADVYLFTMEGVKESLIKRPAGLFSPDLTWSGFIDTFGKSDTNGSTATEIFYTIKSQLCAQDTFSRCSITFDETGVIEVDSMAPMFNI